MEISYKKTPIHRCVKQINQRNGEPGHAVTFIPSLEKVSHDPREFPVIAINSA